MMPRLPRPAHLALSALALSALMTSCTGGEVSTPPRFEAPNVIEGDPKPMGGEPEVQGGEMEMMGGEPMAGVVEPMAGVIEPPLGGEPPLCEPLSPDSIGLFSTGDASPLNTLIGCGGCHVDPGNGFQLSAEINAPQPLAINQIEAVYESLAYYINPGAGADSDLVSRMSDDHGNFLTALPSDDPKVLAMIEWIDSVTPCN